MKNTLITLIIFLLLVVSCQNVDYIVIDTQSDSCKVLNLDQLFESKTYTISDLIDTVKVISLETNSESILSNVQVLKMSDNNSVILDNYQNGSVAIFDKNGKFVCRLRQGNGPGEINGVYSFDVDEQFIYTLQIEKINKYSLTGDFIESYPIYEMHNTLFDCLQNVDDGFLLSINPCESKSGKFEVLHTDKEFNKKRQFVFGHHFHGYSTQDVFRSNNDNVFFFPPLCNTIYKFDGNSFSPLYTLNYPKYENTFETNPDCNSLGLEFQQKHCIQGKFFAEGRMYQTQDYLYLTFFDGYGGLFRMYLNTKIGKFRCGYMPSKEDAPIWTISFNHFVRCADNNYFVTMLSPDAYVSAEGNHLEESVSILQHISDEDKKKILNAKEDDNPLIIMYKLKSIE